MTVRTRFAPSPTGQLHLGNVRVAVFNWLFARRHGGAFVLRLEDTDTERNLAGAEASLEADLRWLGLAWDEGPDVGGPFAPYRQSERSALYRATVERLLDSGWAFPCFCDPPRGGTSAAHGSYPGTCRSLDPGEASRRAAEGAPHVVRFRSPASGDVSVRDEIRGNVTVAASEIDDFVLQRRDGRFTYNLAVVADDLAMEISHVIRGSGHLSNTPKQALIYDALGETRPMFAHLPTVLSPEGGKLSKRTGSLSVASYREAGYLPEALLNYLSLLGWSDPAGDEVLDREQLVARISLDRVRASNAAYDPEKLRWVAAQHLARLPLEQLVAGVRPYLEAEALALGEDELRSLIVALRTRLAAFGDIRDHLSLVLPDDATVEAGRRALGGEAAAGRVLRALHDGLEALPDWVPEALDQAVRSVGKDCGVRGAELFQPLRLALTGQDHGPDLARVLHALGRQRALDRIAEAWNVATQV